MPMSLAEKQHRDPSFRRRRNLLFTLDLHCCIRASNAHVTCRETTPRSVIPTQEESAFYPRFALLYKSVECPFHLPRNNTAIRHSDAGGICFLPSICTVV